jgi:glutamate racemase
LRQAVQAYLGPAVTLVDSGPATAAMLKGILRGQEIESTATPPGRVTYYLSDFQPRFRDLGARFLGRPVEPVEVVSI